jgi:hypothetical protein
MVRTEGGPTNGEQTNPRPDAQDGVEGDALAAVENPGEPGSQAQEAGAAERSVADEPAVGVGRLDSSGRIKTMQRQAYGFRDQEFFKLKIYDIHRAKYA